MKIECSKEEWFWLEIFLKASRNVSTDYKGHEFKCVATDCEGDVTFEIEGTFTDSIESALGKPR